MKRRIVIPGGSGFVGRMLARHFRQSGDSVCVLSRNPGPADGGGVRWDGRSGGAWMQELDGADAVINLAGRSVNCRYHRRNKEAILRSRIDSTRIVGQAIAACRRPPPVWINASSATIYRHALDRPMDEETGEVGHDFSMNVVQRWEEELDAAPTPATRKIALRAAMVLGPDRGGVFTAFERIVRLGLGGTLGSGMQYMSWLHEADLAGIIELLLEHEELSGPINASAPNPVPNRAFMQAMRSACGVPFGLPAARWMLEIGAFVLRTETELLLKSRRVVPALLLRAGYRFRYPEIDAALRSIARCR